MREIGVQKHVSDKLEQVEVAGHKEMETTDIGQIDSAHLENPSSYKCQEVDNEQVFGDCGYITKHLCNLQFDN